MKKQLRENCAADAIADFTPESLMLPIQRLFPLMCLKIDLKKLMDAGNGLERTMVLVMESFFFQAKNRYALTGIRMNTLSALFPRARSSCTPATTRRVLTPHICALEPKPKTMRIPEKNVGIITELTIGMADLHPSK
jgi:hypothetical protein